MPDPKIQPLGHTIWPDHAVARRVFKHILEGPLADPPQAHASLMDLLEYLDAEGVNTATFNGEGHSFIVNWSQNHNKEGS